MPTNILRFKSNKAEKFYRAMLWYTNSIMKGNLNKGDMNIVNDQFNGHVNIHRCGNRNANYYTLSVGEYGVPSITEHNAYTPEGVYIPERDLGCSLKYLDREDKGLFELYSENQIILVGDNADISFSKTMNCLLQELQEYEAVTMADISSICANARVEKIARIPRNYREFNKKISYQSFLAPTINVDLFPVVEFNKWNRNRSRFCSRSLPYIKDLEESQIDEEFSFYVIFSAYRFDKHHKYYRSYDNLKMDALIAKTELQTITKFVFEENEGEFISMDTPDAFSIYPYYM